MFQHIGKWLTPPTFPDEDRSRSAALLCAILMGLAVWMGLGLLVNILIGAANQANIIVGLVSIGLLMVLQGIGRTGRVKLAALLTSTLMLLLVTLAIYNLGTIRTILLGYYFIAFIIPTFLVGPRSGLAFGGLCVLATLGLMFLEQAGVLPDIAPPTVSNQVIVFAELVLILFAIPYLARRTMIQALGQARSELRERKRVEDELREHREHLEELVTERTAQLRTAYEQLDMLSQAKDEFITNVSHELRTPIASLKVHYHLLKENPEQLPKYLETMQRETSRLHRTIEALLNLSRLDQGSMEPKRVPLNLQDLVEQYVQDRMPLALEKELTLSYASIDNLPLVNADPDQLGEALSIMLTNAINYTPNEGQVYVSIKTRRQREKLWVGFSVSDTGPGIPPDELPHLFERFFRGRVGQNSGIPGTGLGLAIAQEIVAKHKGVIEVESRGVPGQGATFSVWLVAEEE